ncbi:glutathione S-transferase family protein [Emydomyces testavorans]|uniref:Glutathione S-transferase family protein n=1 Tax=Emydomyces testavorans TaxID=2070801 RepID=A0AAF0DKY1_9EURO|nr:glutathione S-transferase family protein [Emydomyces testavorans]
MDLDETRTATKSPQSPSELTAVTAIAASDHGLSNLHRHLQAEINNGNEDNVEKLPTEPEGLKPGDSLVEPDNTPKNGQEWDQIIADPDSAVPASDAIATAEIVTEQAQAAPDHAAIAVDPQISTSEAQIDDNNDVNPPSITTQTRERYPSAELGGSSVNANPPQQYSLIGNYQILPPAPLPQSQLIPPPIQQHALPVNTEFAPPQNHLSHLIPLPPYQTPNAPPAHHNYSPQTPARQQQPVSLVPLTYASVQSTPVEPDRNADGDSGFKGMKIVLDPPDLQQWREKLFNVEDTIVLSEEEFQTYFPHIDNVYSHRSTQRYKRKPFISHYWDCRLKGRPPGTPKSIDPNRKKRKRAVRERNLCDVKIKITEYFPGAMTMPSELEVGITTLAGAVDALPGDSGTNNSTSSQPFGVLAPSTMLSKDHPGATGARYYTIQRVNGNGGNGRSDTAGGPHRHTLEESDRIKKSSVQRYILKEEKNRKKAVVSDGNMALLVRNKVLCTVPRQRQGT